MLCMTARTVSHPDVYPKFTLASGDLHYFELEELIACKLTELEREEELKSQ